MEVQNNNIQNGEIGFEVNGNTSRDESLDVFGMMKDQHRVIKKAKRPSKQSPGRETPVGEEPTNGLAPNLQASIAFTKNSRKSRNARGRGLPKKGKKYLYCYMHGGKLFFNSRACISSDSKLHSFAEVAKINSADLPCLVVVDHVFIYQ